MRGTLVPMLIEKLTLVSGLTLTFSRMTVRILVRCSVETLAAPREAAAPWPVDSLFLLSVWALALPSLPFLSAAALVSVDVFGFASAVCR